MVRLFKQPNTQAPMYIELEEENDTDFVPNDDDDEDDDN